MELMGIAIAFTASLSMGLAISGLALRAVFVLMPAHDDVVIAARAKKTF
jgi:hypothetical protein